ncbi:MAG: HIT family protein [Candidatus Micrarchaeaceae archaeon]|jgi:histidine triad (HIT) family protein
MKEDPKKQSHLFKKPETCIFCNVVNNEIERYVVFEDSQSIAFLDMKPLFPGHVLLVPKMHYSEIDQIPGKTIDVLFNNVKLLSKAVESSLGADGTFIAVNNKVSQSVPHLHIHIVPRKFKDGLKGFFWPRYKYSSKEEIEKIKDKIANAIK